MLIEIYEFCTLFIQKKSLRKRYPYFSAFGLNMERYGVSLRIQSECGEIRTRITPNTDTFDAVSKHELVKFTEEVTQTCSIKEVLLKISISFPSKETPAQEISTETCEFFKNVCFAEPLRRVLQYLLNKRHRTDTYILTLTRKLQMQTATGSVL